MNNAKLITSSEYMNLIDPIFQGQTKTDNNGDYKMYWLSEGQHYVTHNNLFT